MTSSAVPAEWMCIVSGMSPWLSSERSMLMIGVMPLPALMNRIFSGTGSGSRKSPSTPPRPTIAPCGPLRTRYGETTPSSTFLTVIEMQPSSRLGSEVSE